MNVHRSVPFTARSNGPRTITRFFFPQQQQPIAQLVALHHRRVAGVMNTARMRATINPRRCRTIAETEAETSHFTTNPRFIISRHLRLTAGPFP